MRIALGVIVVLACLGRPVSARVSHLPDRYILGPTWLPARPTLYLYADGWGWVDPDDPNAAALAAVPVEPPPPPVVRVDGREVYHQLRPVPGRKDMWALEIEATQGEVAVTWDKADDFRGEIGAAPVTPHLDAEIRTDSELYPFIPTIHIDSRGAAAVAIVGTWLSRYHPGDLVPPGPQWDLLTGMRPGDAQRVTAYYVNGLIETRLVFNLDPGLPGPTGQPQAVVIPVAAGATLLGCFGLVAALRRFLPRRRSRSG